MLSKTPQFKRGKNVEAFLDELFVYRGWSIEQTTPYEERKLCLGDRRFTKDGQTLLIEYKSGIQTHYTGNVFLETISVDTTCAQGWVYTCQADYILYACLLDNVILVFNPKYLRKKIARLKIDFPERSTGDQNAGYKTHGVCVPLDYAIEHLADKVIAIESEDTP